MTNKERVTVVNLGWSACYIVDVKDVTPLLEILNRSQPVDRRWANDAYWVLKDRSDSKVSVEQDSCPVVSEEEWKEIAKRVEAEREAKKAAEEAEAANQ